ncbi:hypothetical protein EJ04DRAFT_525268 [Polyplosphaeria fusca]|uniref:CCHC-type domain-containing protein n=1 Tax=Polyplosphaeria fusca TaxID=682080 RepID=A0A9P4QRP8_9PLEO|nr:hypothetical protein EJ04DRAFT_525268 [Polyplosphaeria fusca]
MNQQADQTSPRTMNQLYHGSDGRMAIVAYFCTQYSTTQLLRHVFGVERIKGAPMTLDDAILVSFDTEWWEKEPKPTMEIGYASLCPKNMANSLHYPHAENLLVNIRGGHARLKATSHLKNKFYGAGNADNFEFGTTVFVTKEEATEIIIEIFSRPSAKFMGMLRPVIFVGHAVDSDFEQIEKNFGLNLLQLGSIVKVVDTQILAQEAYIRSFKGPFISLKDLLAHFNIFENNLHTAGQDAVYTMIAAVLVTFKRDLYGRFTPLCVPQITVHGRKIGDVMENLKLISSYDSAPKIGLIYYCTRCGEETHLREDCRTYICCSKCTVSYFYKHRNAAYTHRDETCLWD